MRLVITEKQLRGIIKSAEMKEQDATETAPSSPEATSTDTETPSADSGGTYPSVTKWESGVTRGPANQISVTKWSDIVGNTIKRGKSNPLN